MKSIFRTLAIASTLILSNTWATSPRFMILFSGTPSKDFKNVLNQSLSHTLPEWEELSRFERDNPDCQYRKQYLIQFCLKGDKLTIVHQDEKALKRTLSKLMAMDESQTE